MNNFKKRQQKKVVKGDGRNLISPNRYKFWPTEMRERFEFFQKKFEENWRTGNSINTTNMQGRSGRTVLTNVFIPEGSLTDLLATTRLQRSFLVDQYKVCSAMVCWLPQSLFECGFTFMQKTSGSTFHRVYNALQWNITINICNIITLKWAWFTLHSAKGPK